MQKRVIVAENLIDGTRANHITAASILEDQGCIVFEAKDGQEVIDLFMQNRDIDIILIAFDLPGKNGFEVACEIRRYAPMITICILASTLESYMAKNFRIMGVPVISEFFGYQELLDAVGLGRQQYQFA